MYACMSTYIREGLHMFLFNSMLVFVTTCSCFQQDVAALAMQLLLAHAMRGSAQHHVRARQHVRVRQHVCVRTKEHAQGVRTCPINKIYD